MSWNKKELGRSSGCTSDIWLLKRHISSLLHMWLCSFVHVCIQRFTLQAQHYLKSHVSSVALWMVMFHHFGPDWNISTTTGWIVMKCGRSWSPDDESYCLWWSSDIFSRATSWHAVLGEMSRQLLGGLPWNLAQTFIVHLKMNCYHVDDPLTFHPVLSSTIHFGLWPNTYKTHNVPIPLHLLNILNVSTVN